MATSVIEKSLAGDINSLTKNLISHSVTDADLNNLTDVGAYSVNGTITHGPLAQISYIQVYVLTTNFAWRLQFATNGTIWWYRCRANASTAWDDWTRVFRNTPPSVTAGSVSVLPAVYGNGSTVTLESVAKIPAGTYSTGIWTVSPPPLGSAHFLAMLGSNVAIMRLNANGTIDFNNQVTLSSDTWLIGSITYAV